MEKFSRALSINFWSIISSQLFSSIFVVLFVVVAIFEIKRNFVNFSPRSCHWQLLLILISLALCSYTLSNWAFRTLLFSVDVIRFFPSNFHSFSSYICSRLLFGVVFLEKRFCKVPDFKFYIFPFHLLTKLRFSI